MGNSTDDVGYRTNPNICQKWGGTITVCEEYIYENHEQQLQ